MEEKIEMYNEKKQFIENLNEVFAIAPGCSSVEGVSYEVYTKDFGEDRIDTKEWVIVHYKGSGFAPRVISGNSNAANFVVVGSMLQGGCYEQVQFYNSQLENGYTKVEI
jgi:hypothetical protein